MQLIAFHPNELPFSSNNIAVVDLPDRKICIARVGDQLRAFSHKCPHASGPMSDGWIDALGNVVCPTHRYRFDTKNGRNTSGEGYFLKTYKIIENEDGVWVDV